MMPGRKIRPPIDRPTLSSATKASITSDQVYRKKYTMRPKSSNPTSTRITNQKTPKLQKSNNDKQNNTWRVKVAHKERTAAEYHHSTPVCRQMPRQNHANYHPEKYQDNVYGEWGEGTDHPEAIPVSPDTDSADINSPVSEPEAHISPVTSHPSHKHETLAGRRTDTASEAGYQAIADVDDNIIDETSILLDKLKVVSDNETKNATRNGMQNAKPMQKSAQTKREEDREDYPYAKHTAQQEKDRYDKQFTKHRPEVYKYSREDLTEDRLNLQFYSNEIKYKPWGCKIEELLQYKGDHSKLESDHSYIQWLFPTQDASRTNSYSQPMQPEEAEAIREDPVLQRRFRQAYEMMLDFYGMKLASEETGEIERGKNCIQRLAHLNRSGHNHHRISRILTALGIFGYGHFQKPCLMFIMKEMFEGGTLSSIPDGVLYHWIDTVYDFKEKTELMEEYTRLLAVARDAS